MAGVKAHQLRSLPKDMDGTEQGSVQGRAKMGWPAAEHGRRLRVEQSDDTEVVLKCDALGGAWDACRDVGGCASELEQISHTLPCHERL